MPDEELSMKFQGIHQDEQGWGLAIFPPGEKYLQVLYLTLEQQDLILTSILERWKTGTLKCQRLETSSILPPNKAK